MTSPFSESLTRVPCFTWLEALSLQCILRLIKSLAHCLYQYLTQIASPIKLLLYVVCSLMRIVSRESTCVHLESSCQISPWNRIFDSSPDMPHHTASRGALWLTQDTVVHTPMVPDTNRPKLTTNQSAETMNLNLWAPLLSLKVSAQSMHSTRHKLRPCWVSRKSHRAWADLCRRHGQRPVKSQAWPGSIVYLFMPHDLIRQGMRGDLKDIYGENC